MIDDPIKEAIKKYGPIQDRWIIRLGKDDGEFDPWHVEGAELFQDDFTSFSNALSLYRSVESTEDRVAVITDAKKEIRRAAEKAVKDAERAIECLDAKKYKGTRKKKGCNDTDKMCETCTKKYLDKSGKSPESK